MQACYISMPKLHFEMIECQNAIIRHTSYNGKMLLLLSNKHKSLPELPEVSINTKTPCMLIIFFDLPINFLPSSIYWLAGLDSFAISVAIYDSKDSFAILYYEI